jgi:hypothetical protein
VGSSRTTCGGGDPSRKGAKPPTLGITHTGPGGMPGPAMTFAGIARPQAAMPANP